MIKHPILSKNELEDALQVDLYPANLPYEFYAVPRDGDLERVRQELASKCPVTIRLILVKWKPAMKICTKDYIGVYGRCRDCASDVSFYCIGADLFKERPQAKTEPHSKWWVACDNPECDNHQGESTLDGVKPKWVKGSKP